MRGMRAFGFVLLLAGWGLVLAALGMLHSSTVLAAFVTAGAGVEVLGLALAVRSYLPSQD